MVRPHIEYATQVWSPQYKKDKITLENVQRRTTHLVKCIIHLSYSERLKTLGLPTLEHRGPARFFVDLGHISVYFLPNIYFFSTDMCPKSTKKRAGPLCFGIPETVQTRFRSTKFLMTLIKQTRINIPNGILYINKGASLEINKKK